MTLFHGIVSSSKWLQTINMNDACFLFFGYFITCYRLKDGGTLGGSDRMVRWEVAVVAYVE
jgi:hypothetical protein